MASDNLNCFCFRWPTRCQDIAWTKTTYCQLEHISIKFYSITIAFIPEDALSHLVCKMLPIFVGLIILIYMHVTIICNLLTMSRKLQEKRQEHLWCCYCSLVSIIHLEWPLTYGGRYGQKVKCFDMLDHMFRRKKEKYNCCYTILHIFREHHSKLTCHCNICNQSSAYYYIISLSYNNNWNEINCMIKPSSVVPVYIYIYIYIYIICVCGPRNLSSLCQHLPKSWT